MSQLHQQQFPILPGFVIGSQVFHQFLEQLDDSSSLLADFPASSLYLNVDNPQALQLVARQSRQTILHQSLSEQSLLTLQRAADQLNSPTLILRASITTPVEIPSKATRLLSSQVCWNTPESLELALKKLWSQLFSSKSLLYWQRMGIGLEKVNLAVLIQPITNAIASGIAHLEADYIRVQASWGLGHSLLQGEVLPDLYHIVASTGKIESQHLGNKTRGYRLISQSLSSSSRESCLEPYPLSQEEQEQYCLKDDFLVELSQIFNKLDHTINNFLEWTLTYYNNPEAEFYIIESNFNYHKNRLFSIANSEQSMSESQPIITGLSASSGIIYAQAHVLTNFKSSLEAIPEGKILVAKKMMPDWLPGLKQALGIIVEEGGVTSHAAIIARELGIPAIVSATGATDLLTSGDFIQLDGERGEVYLESEKITPSSRKKEQENKILTQSFIANYPIGTRLMVNLSQTSSIADSVILPVDGIGLLRSDLMLLELLTEQPLQAWLHHSQKNRLVEQWSQLISEFASKFAPRPVFYRSLDLTTTENKRHFEGETINSLLGYRGTLKYRLNPHLFALELQVLEQVYQTGNSNVNLILPFVRSVEEFKYCRHRVEQTQLTQQQSFQLWIMAEVPSVIFLLPQYIAAGVQGIAIGTNDLTQLLLGVDREQGKLNQLYNPTHPAMLAALKQLITQAKTAGIPCSICGQAPVEYPELIDYLVSWGITSISVEPEAVEKTYHIITRAEQRLILEKSRSH